MTTKTTFHLSISQPALAVARIRAWLLQHDPLALLAVPAMLLIVGLLFARQLTSAPAVAAVPTPQLPIIMIATAPAQLVPTAAPTTKATTAGHTLSRAAVAYDAPDGAVIGAIEQGRSFQLLARYGVDWLQADVSGSGVVWLRSADVFDMPTDLADLAPGSAPQTVYASAPVDPSYQVASQPPPPPPTEALRGSLIVMTEAQQAAVDRQFGLTDAQRARAFAEHQARQAALAAGLHPPTPPADQQLPTSEDMPCNCP